MLLRVASWLFQLPGRLLAPLFRSRLSLLIFFMLVAAGVFLVKHHLSEGTQEESFPLATPQHYVIQRETPLREARQHCVGPLPDNQGSPWPTSAGYLHEPDWHAGSQLQTLMLDNQRNQFAVLVKLENTTKQLLAEVFLPAASSFNLKLESNGRYVMKVKDIHSGCSFRTALSVADRPDGTLPLTFAEEGPDQYHPIGDREF
ncbi:MAG: hypothetical protein ACRDCA_07805 [Serratia sp. (in: enterobacteria)]|uniref:hypothetical protein n=1 Tax=Serratia sp. (in: enterobacteria) TaxID=616 RepID=UPI003F386EFD